MILGDIIDFISIKKEKNSNEVKSITQKAHSLKNPIEIDRLINGRELSVEEHKLFLAFLTYLDEKQLVPLKVFEDFFTLSKYNFEQHYVMNWSSIEYLSITFLTILRESNPKAYEKLLKITL